MKRSRFTEDQIIGILKEHEAGVSVADLCRKHGVSEQKLDVLAAWEEAGDLFSARERAALALTEAVTLIADGVPDDVYESAAAVFSDRELAQVIAMAVTINAWNRFGVGFAMVPA